jgi:predicted Zn-dependent protease
MSAQRKGSRSISILIAIVVAAISLFKYYGTSSVNDITGEKQHVAVTPEQEVAMGLQSAPGMAEEFGGLSRNQAAAAIVNQVGQQIVQKSTASKTPYKYDFHLLADQQTINAFALPGGRIVLFSGLLDKMGSAEELAGLLGHEVGHVKHRHSIKAQMRSLSTYLFVSLLLSDVNGVTAVLMDNAKMLSNLSYSRKLEHLADEEALAVLQKNHISQSGLVDLFRTLQGEAGEEPQFLKFLSSHPLTQDRLDFAKKAAAKQRGEQENLELKEIWERIESEGKKESELPG